MTISFSHFQAPVSELLNLWVATQRRSQPDLVRYLVVVVHAFKSIMIWADQNDNYLQELPCSENDTRLVPSQIVPIFDKIVKSIQNQGLS